MTARCSNPPSRGRKAMIRASSAPSRGTRASLTMRSVRAAVCSYWNMSPASTSNSPWRTAQASRSSAAGSCIAAVTAAGKRRAVLASNTAALSQPNAGTSLTVRAIGGGTDNPDRGLERSQTISAVSPPSAATVTTLNPPGVSPRTAARRAVMTRSGSAWLILAMAERLCGVTPSAASTRLAVPLLPRIATGQPLRRSERARSTARSDMGSRVAGKGIK